MKLAKKMAQLPDQFFAKLSTNVANAIAEGRDVINLGQGNPDRPTPIHIVEAMQEATTDAATHKYSPFRGTTEIREAIATFYRREYGVELDPDEEVAVLFGSKAGLVELPMVLLDEGDTMLLPDPGYPDYLSGVTLANIQFEKMPLLKENAFLPDYTALTDAQKEASKLLYINYPNNPTGAVATDAFFEETVQFAKENDIAVMHDFAYSSLGFDGVKPRSFLQTEGAKDVGVEFYTLSKTYNMAGWRVGFAVGNRDIVGGLNLLQDHLFCSLFPAIQHAAAVALTSSQSCVEEQLHIYESRRNALKDAAERIGWHIDVPKGSFFAWLPVPERMTSAEFATILLNQANVAVADGRGFGEYGEGYVRVGLLVEEARIYEAMDRIAALHLFD